MENNIYKNENYMKNAKVLEEIDIESLWKNFCKEIVDKWK
jgi:hypothetical protein